MNFHRPFIQNHYCAAELIEEGMRIALVQSLTGIAWRPLRELWTSIHGDQKLPGRMPNNTLSYISRGGQSHLVLSTIAACFFSAMQDKQMTEIEAFIKSWSTAKLFDGNDTTVDINAAWFAIRDCKAGLVTLCKCKVCDANYILDAISAKKTSPCPFCGSEKFGRLECA